jgi:hypothetical protein
VAYSGKPQGSVYAWQIPGDLHWFHYTTAPYAREIRREGYYVVSQSDHQGRGTGMFVTNRNPFEVTADELLTELFSRQRGLDAVEAVVVLLRNDKLFPVKKIGHRCYMHYAKSGAAIDISPFLRGMGIREEAEPSGWFFSPELRVPKLA